MERRCPQHPGLAFAFASPCDLGRVTTSPGLRAFQFPEELRTRERLSLPWRDSDSVRLGWACTSGSFKRPQVSGCAPGVELTTLVLKRGP